MLPAHGYPGLRKYKHLVGHWGGPWNLQKVEFAEFPGAILMTTNCLIEPRKSYADRIFTRHSVGFKGIRHLDSMDFSDVIEAALKAPGFTAEDCKAYKPKTFNVGFARNTLLSNAGAIVNLVKTGKVSHFFFIGGCDGNESERSYFRDLAKISPKDSFILTAGCGKYRVNGLPLGDIAGFPRVLDCGQCNDSFSAIQVAIALTKAFNMKSVNDLPLSFAVSWFEQKAVAVLLTLLYLNVQKIRLGPHLPAFATPGMLKILNEKFKLMPVNHKDVKADLELMMKGQ
jgi:hydroxylamine reductase